MFQHKSHGFFFFLHNITLISVAKIFLGVYFISFAAGGFFLACEDFRRVFDHSPPALFLIFFYIKVEISSHTLIPLFRPGSVHSGLAS